jgi:hypothetical protein
MGGNIMNKDDVKINKYYFSEDNKCVTVFYSYKGHHNLMAIKLKETDITAKTYVSGYVTRENYKQIREVILAKLKNELGRKIFSNK